MSGALLIIQAVGEKALRRPACLSPEMNCLVTTYPINALAQVSNDPERVDETEHARLNLFLSQPLSLSETDSLPPFLLSLIHTHQIQNILIAHSHPLLSAVLGLNFPEQLRIWIDVQNRLNTDLAIFPTNPAALWLCDAVENAEYLLLQGQPISQIVYPQTLPVHAREQMLTLAELDAYLRGNPETTQEQNLALPLASLKGLGSYLFPKTQTDTEIESESKHFCLILIEPDNQAWKPTLASFIKHYQMNPEMALVMLPSLQSGLDAVALLYEQLLAWFDSEQIDSEQTPEIIVLDPAELKEWILFPTPPVFIAHSDTERQIHACLQVLREGGLVVAQSEALTQKLNAIQMGTSQVPAGGNAIFKPWLEQLSGATIYLSQPDAYYLWNQSLFETAMKSLSIGQ